MLHAEPPGEFVVGTMRRSPPAYRMACQQRVAPRYSGGGRPDIIAANVKQIGYIGRDRVARLVATLTAVAFALSPVPALATGVFVVDFPWVRPAARGGTTEAFMELTSGEGGTLVAVRSEVAAHAYLAGPGQGSAEKTLLLPSGAPVVLAPGSYRVRLAGLARTLQVGDRVPLVLVIETPDGRREDLRVDAEVRRRSTVDDHLHGHSHPHEARRPSGG